MKLRQLIIVYGLLEVSQDFVECCRVFGGKDIKVYMLKLYEIVDVTSEIYIYQVNLLVFELYRSKCFLLQIRDRYIRNMVVSEIDMVFCRSRLYSLWGL